MSIKITLPIAAIAALVAFPAMALGVMAAPAASPYPITRVAADALLDINTATKAQLMALKGIGDKRADDIVKARPYKGKDDLVQKKIVPQPVYDGFKDKIIAKQK